MVTRDVELNKRHAVGENFRKRVKGLRTDLRNAQSPLEVQKGRVETSADRAEAIVRASEVTRTESGIRVSERADENAGAELLENWQDEEQRRKLE